MKNIVEYLSYIVGIVLPICFMIFAIPGEGLSMVLKILLNILCVGIIGAIIYHFVLNKL